MKVPYGWLKDYVDIDVTAKELGDILTMTGSNVEEVITSGDEIKNVVTGKLLKIEPHPDADKLVICQVEVASKETIQIVTGADNMKEGDIVPVALHGASLPGGVKIKKGKLRGILSNGMMCSAQEIGIEEENPIHGLMILPKDTTVGCDIKSIFNLDNAVIDFEITSNRPDCLSIIGIARETAASLNKSYKQPNLKFNALYDGSINDELKVEVHDNLCRRYMARKVKNVKIAPSPQWMQDRLNEAGVRSINNIVDITNFVMLELGQPMHAFDARQIKSGKIVVDMAEEGEKFTTLDENERTLNSDVLTIRDDSHAVALAGIMGGLNSGAYGDTSEIIFESANFDGINIRKSSKFLGLRTEASLRYEKDIDAEITKIALDRACNLVCELNCGEIMKDTIDIYNVKPLIKKVTVSASWVNTFLGTDIVAEDMKKYLERLEFACDLKDDVLYVTSPSFRIDIGIKEDIAEEIARIYGYDKVPCDSIKSVSEKSGKSEKQKLDDKVLDTMLASGYNQSISYSFVSPKVFDKILVPKDSALRNTVVIKNPLGEDFSIMRTTSIPSMMDALSRNYSRNNSNAALFEIGKVYIPNEDKNKIPLEKNILTIGLYGKCDYFDLKGVIENLVSVLGIEQASYARESENTTFHPGRCAGLIIKRHRAGILGEIYPDVLENYEIEEKCYIAEIDLDILYSVANTNKKYKALPKFPAITRDMALIVDEEVLTGELQDVMIKHGGNILYSIQLFDVYKGKQIPDGKKSVAYSLSYRGDNRTLKDDEANKVHEKILKALEHTFSVQLR